MAATLILSHLVLILRGCTGKINKTLHSRYFLVSFILSGRNFAAVCCTELKIDSSLSTPNWLSRYNTFNSTATDLSGLYRAIKGTPSKGRHKKA